MFKKKIKIYPDNTLYESDYEFLKARNIESASKYIAGVLSILVVLSVIIGFISAMALDSNFGIKFATVASLDDYIRLAVTNIPSAAIVAFCLSLYIPVIHSYKRSQYNFFMNKIGKLRLLSSYFFAILYVLTLILAINLFLPSSIQVDLDEKLLGIQKIYKTHSYAQEIKNGSMGLKSIQYGKDLKQKDCLSFIAEIGGRYYFWDVTRNSLVSVDKSNVVLISSQLESLKDFFNKKNLSILLNKAGDKYPEQLKTLDEWDNIKMAMCPTL